MLASRVLQAQNHVLEAIARGAPQSVVLCAIAAACETLTPGVLASVLLVEDRKLRHGAAPSLPDAFLHAVDGAPIGPCAGSCGTAAHLNERVIVEDIHVHPYWADYLALAAIADVRACWSEPIRSTRGEVLGTFAMYYRQPRAPGADDLELIASFAHLAAVAIERARGEAELARYREQLEQLVAERTAEIKVLRGMLPICAWCKRVRDDDGLWDQIEAYVAAHSEATFSHGICPECAPKLKS